MSYVHWMVNTFQITIFFSLYCEQVLWIHRYILYVFMNVKEEVFQGFQIHGLKTGPRQCHNAGNNFWLKIWQRRENRRGKSLACRLSEGGLGLWVAGQGLICTQVSTSGLSERIKPIKIECFKNKADGQVRKAHYSTTQHGLFK